MRSVYIVCFLAAAILQSGCQSVPPATAAKASPPPAMVLLPGDEVEISVFGVPELSTGQRIRPDGKLTIKLVGDITAAGKTPSELRDEITRLYETQIQVKAVTVIARSSAVVYVSGAVNRPGKVEYLRPMTALEAIMEAGGFDERAGARRAKVRIIRTEGDEVKSYPLDLDAVLTSGGHTAFYLRPFDTVFVPSTW